MVALGNFVFGIVVMYHLLLKLEHSLLFLLIISVAISGRQCPGHKGACAKGLMCLTYFITITNNKCNTSSTTGREKDGF